MTPLRTFAAISFALAFGAAYAQKSSDWIPSTINPVTIAQNAQKVMTMFRGVDGAVSIQLISPAGKGGGYFTPQFKSAKIFRLDQPVYQGVKAKNALVR